MGECWSCLVKRKFKYLRTVAWLFAAFVIALAFQIYNDQGDKERREGGCELLRVFDDTYGTSLKEFLEEARRRNSVNALDPKLSDKAREEAKKSAERYAELYDSLRPLSIEGGCDPEQQGVERRMSD